MIRERLRPTEFLDDIYRLDLDRLKRYGIRALIFDIDNTLVTYDDLTAPKHTADWFDLLHEAGFKTYLVSNNNEDRVSTFAASLGEKYYARALKPRRRYLLSACADMGVKPEETALFGDQLFTDIYGGNRLGMRTYFVKAISDKENWFVHFKRGLEKYFLRGWL